MTREEQLTGALEDLKEKIRDKRHEVQELVGFLSDLEDDIEGAVDMPVGVTESTMVDDYEALFREVNTPELRETIGEDAWITIQRSIFHRIQRRLDADIPLRTLIADAIKEVRTHFKYLVEEEEL